MQQITVPLNRLRAADVNPRIGVDAEHVKELRASIKAHGVLQNLIACPDPAAPDTYRVVAGRSRLTALEGLVADGELAADFPVPVQVRDAGTVELLQVALAENVVRRDMLPIDEAIAFAELARAGVPEAAIAETFGCSERTVKKRLALGRLVPAAQQAIRDGRRNLDWGGAMAGADVATQNRIMRDIEQNPQAWTTGHEVHRLLTSDAIPAAHALFDPARYTGRMVLTLFDGDYFLDRPLFWQLQDAAIDELREQLIAEGWSGVEVRREPVDLHRYEQTTDRTIGHCVIQVLSNGSVTIHRGLVETRPALAAETEAGNLEAQVAAELEGGYVGASVRSTPNMLAYAADQRSAMLQAALGADQRACLEVVVAGLIGHVELPISGVNHRFVGDVDGRTSAAFQEVTRQREELRAIYTAMGIADAGRTGAGVLAAVMELDDTGLETLFRLLVATKIGQNRPRRIDANPRSAANMLGERLAIEVRGNWRPDEAFFQLQNAADLRRIAQTLLPRDRLGGLASARKPNLVRLLTDAFEDAAANSGTLDAATRDRLNAWTPGLLAFPAQDDRDAVPATPAEEADPLAALFGGEPTEALFEAA